jgi:hypothetical protein
MAIVPMADAVAGQVASSTEYNKLIDNIIDLDTRLTGIGGTRYNMERRNNASFAITSGTNTKVPFDTSINAGSGITYTGGTTRSFTITNAGVYTFSTSLRTDTTAGLYVWIAPASDQSQDRGKNSSSGGVSIGTSATFRVSAGSAWSVWMWASTGLNLIRESGTGLAPWISIEYVGPQ